MRRGHLFVHETRVADINGLYIDGIDIVDGDDGVDIGDGGIDMYRTVLYSRGGRRYVKNGASIRCCGIQGADKYTEVKVIHSGTIFNARGHKSEINLEDQMQ
jgi:hypothetical protein